MFDVAAYLQRIDYDGRLSPSAETLRSLHLAHLFSVPFENLDVGLGVPIVLDGDALFAKVIVRHRGGFCYELNGLLARLLRRLGFDVSLLRSHGLVEAANPGLTLTWVDRGADLLAGRGRIGHELATALKAEARRRAEGNAFFGYMAYASLIGRKGGG